MNSSIRLFWLASLVTTVTSSAVMLTPYISNNKTEEARQLSTVDPALFLNKESYAGFFTVDERYNSNIFFWYFPVAKKSVEKTPWIIWLQGGPGASSLAGLFDEIGPFEYDPTTRNIKERQYAWTKMYSIVFVDNPVGAGFSFTDSPRGYPRDIATCTTHLMEAISQFLKIFRELTHAPLYIAGESYGGVYVPNLALKIHRQDNATKKVHVNLQGVILGTPLLNRISTANYSATFYKWGFIDTQGVLSMKVLQDSYFSAIHRRDAIAAYEFRQILLDKLKALSQQPQMFNILRDDIIDELKSFVNFLNERKIKDAIHVGSIEFTFSNATSRYMLAPDFLAGGGPDTVELLEHYKVLIYCGTFDLLIPCVEDAAYRRANWNWSKLDEFVFAPRVPWWFNNTLAGYSKSGGRLTEVVVRTAGHMVAMDKPAEVYFLVASFIDDTKLPMHPDFIAAPEDTPDIIFPPRITDLHIERFVYIHLQTCILVSTVAYVTVYMCTYQITLYNRTTNF